MEAFSVRTSRLLLSVMFGFLVLGLASPVYAQEAAADAANSGLVQWSIVTAGFALAIAAATRARSASSAWSGLGMSGTMMTISNNSAQGYTFKAELIGANGQAVSARTCTLPPGNQPALESWPEKATAVRIGEFKSAKGGRC